MRESVLLLAGTLLIKYTRVIVFSQADVRVRVCVCFPVLRLLIRVYKVRW